MLTHLDATLAEFERHLHAYPEDTTARLLMADVLEELGRHALADLQRRVARRLIRPYEYLGFGWYDASTRWPGDPVPESNLPHSVFVRLDGYDIENSTSGRKWYGTLAAALEALAAAWEPEGGR